MTQNVFKSSKISARKTITYRPYKLKCDCDHTYRNVAFTTHVEKNLAKTHRNVSFSLKSDN